MRCFFKTSALAVFTGILAVGSSLAQSYPRNPSDYKPGNAGVMGIGPGGREAYHPDYYSSSPFARYWGYGYGPWNYQPNVTGLPSQPMAAPDAVYSGHYHSRYYTSAPSHPNAAAIDVKLPAKAQLWFQGQQVRQDGPVRFFESPPLEEGKTYAYKVKAVWTDENGEKVERTRTVQVRTGAYVTLDLSKPKS